MTLASEESSLATTTLSFERVPSRIPVMLILKHLGWEFQHSAWRVDLPSGGLRIRTEPALNEGQVVYLFSDEGVLRPRYCRVVWVPTEGSDRPCEAGLELLPPWATCGESREATQKRA
jgi:hypothetical protein